MRRKSSLQRVFAKRVSVHGQWFPDNVTQLCNELVNPYPPVSPPSTVAALLALERRRLCRWPWSPWRDHTRGLATSSAVLACCSRITFGFGTWACRLLTLLHREYNSISASRNVISDVAKEFYDVVAEVSNSFGCTIKSCSNSKASDRFENIY